MTAHYPYANPANPAAIHRRHETTPDALDELAWAHKVDVETDGTRKFVVIGGVEWSAPLGVTA